MKIVLSAIVATRLRSRSTSCLLLRDDYLTKIRHFSPCEERNFDSEETLLSWIERQAGRTSPVLILLDSRGGQLSSEEIAARLGRLRDSGSQTVVFAIGPANGWSTKARERAGFLLSFGRITLPHELAAVVLAEQVYRAFTILTGHPYHSGH